MRKYVIIVLVGCLFAFPALAHAQLAEALEGLLGERQPRIHAEDLQVLQLEFAPDPLRQGEQPVFRATVLNRSRNQGRVSFVIKDRDEVVTEVRDVVLRQGENLIEFPQPTYYRFSRSDHCFVVEADIARSRRPLDLAKEFCAQRTAGGWTLSGRDSSRLFVEDLVMNPDPVMSGQPVGFNVRLRNDGWNLRGDIRIMDGDQIVARLENTQIPRGLTEFRFPPGQYVFQRFDTCFTVVVDIDRTPRPVDAKRQFCAKPAGWSLKRGFGDDRRGPSDNRGVQPR